MPSELEYNLSELIEDMKICAEAAGFCTFKFGPHSSINFDHNICYDLINIDYPTSSVTQGDRANWNFDIIIGRPLKKSNTLGIQTMDDVHIAMTDLATKFWNFISCCALGFSGGGDCGGAIPKHLIRIVRDKGKFNDNLITLHIQFTVQTNLKSYQDPCGSSISDDPCDGFYGNPFDPCAGLGNDPCSDNDNFPPTYPTSQTSNP
jgi:hypothetical protein